LIAFSNLDEAPANSIAADLGMEIKKSEPLDSEVMDARNVRSWTKRAKITHASSRFYAAHLGSSSSSLEKPSRDQVMQDGV
jgi:hypothetical protein